MKTLEEIDTALHELREQWLVETDEKKRRALYRQIDRLLDERLALTQS